MIIREYYSAYSTQNSSYSDQRNMKTLWSNASKSTKFTNIALDLRPNTIGYTFHKYPVGFLAIFDNKADLFYKAAPAREKKGGVWRG